MLEFLAGDRSARVRGVVAENPRFPGEALGLLAADIHTQVRVAVARFGGSLGDPLGRLATDRIKVVQKAATVRQAA
ncbi:MAG: hypothetical protein RMJ98_19545 [Myxococcales bacterium]|nr:hypothetical protein [Polyangiaceae bacterium]MDW8251495.1 hypothetical protein [Myxococcales bacterium]